MRIISGKYRGMKLAEFEGAQIRPTADRVKESLFNILYSYVSGARVLDLFCGSGNLGIECLSRGAQYVHFNDISAESVAVLKKNLSRLKADNFTVTNLDYSVCLSGLKGFDLVFIDPPYKSEAGINALEFIGKNAVLTAGGIAVYERDIPFSGEVAGLKKFDERKYGKTYLTFFEA
ncbi:MAG: 16S rRNA (guanine(966)-N(2))-methyltransferase RsmD [Clostridia bacterium]|nr:16S rRNA (guanine(966)-N(2))-methyltransferase RsmD [Clostridia bacterium]